MTAWNKGLQKRTPQEQTVWERERAQQRRAAWSPERRELERARRRAYYEHRREGELAVASRSRARRRDPLAVKAKLYRSLNWEKRLMKVYGLLEGQYTEMLAEQGGVCAICGKKPGRVRLAVDHDHKTGRIRGLLHSRCNRGLGLFEFSDDVLYRLVGYIDKILADRAISA